MDPEHPVPGAGDGDAARGARRRGDRRASSRRGPSGSPLLLASSCATSAARSRRRRREHGALDSIRRASTCMFAVGIAPDAGAAREGARRRERGARCPAALGRRADVHELRRAARGCTPVRVRAGLPPAAADQGRGRPAQPDPLEPPAGGTGLVLIGIEHLRARHGDADRAERVQDADLVAVGGEHVRQALVDLGRLVRAAAPTTIPCAAARRTAA